jgi:arylsulfatase A-like enzyme
MELAGLDAARGAAPSLRPLWSAGAPAEWPAPRLGLAQRPWDSENTPIRHGSMRSLVQSDWHFIDHDTFGPELYDFVRDPAEQHDLARDAAHQDLVPQFKGRFTGTSTP